MPLILPYTIAPADDINAEPLQANFQAVIDKFSANIVDGDISPLAAIQGSKVASNTLPADRIQSGTITATQMGANSVGNTQLAALAVTKDKLTLTAGQKITKTQIEMAVYPGTVGASTGGGNTATDVMATVGQATVLSVNSWTVNVRFQTPTGPYFGTLTPTAPIPVATTTPIGVVLRNPTFTPGGASVDVDLVYITNS